MYQYVIHCKKKINNIFEVFKHINLWIIMRLSQSKLTNGRLNLLQMEFSCVKDVRHPEISPFLRHNMTIWTHCETVYITNRCCLYLWCNGWSFNLPICRSQVRIPHRILFSWIVVQFKNWFVSLKIGFLGVIFKSNTC